MGEEKMIVSNEKLREYVWQIMIVSILVLVLFIAGLVIAFQTGANKEPVERVKLVQVSSEPVIIEKQVIVVQNQSISVSEAVRELVERNEEMDVAMKEWETAKR
jgi:hypothetical protein